MTIRLLALLSGLLFSASVAAQITDNRLIEWNFPAGTTVRTGVPAESPTKIVEAFSAYFAQHPNIKRARLGLAEFVPPKREAVFSYVIGIEASSDEALALSDLKKIALANQMGRWGVMVVSLKSEARLFTDEAIVLYRAKGGHDWPKALDHL